MGYKKTPRNPKGHEANLIHITKETAKELGRKGGKANKGNKNLIVASKLRWLKKKGLSDDNAAHLYEVITEHDLSALDVRLFLEGIKKDAHNARQKNDLARNLIEWHKMQHGQTIRNENKNMNINVDISADIDEIKEHLGKF